MWFHWLFIPFPSARYDTVLVVVQVLFARQHAVRQHAHGDQACAHIHSSPSRKEGNEATTLHSLQNVLVVGWWPPSPLGHETSIPCPSFYVTCVSRLASLLLSWACFFRAFCRKSSLVHGCEWCSQVTRTILNTSRCLNAYLFCWSFLALSARSNRLKALFILLWVRPVLEVANMSGALDII